MATNSQTKATRKSPFTLLLASIISLVSTLNLAVAQRCATTEYMDKLDSIHDGLKETRLNTLLRINEAIEAKNTQRTTTVEKIYRIPVAVHIIHTNPSGAIGGKSNTNISDEQIYSQIKILNEDYRRLPNTPGFNNDAVGSDTKIEFCLATRDPTGMPTTGITRTYSTFTNWDIYSETDDKKLKGLAYWPANQYLNIWVSQLSNKILGYGTFPMDDSRKIKGLENGGFPLAQDGVVLDYRAFGNTGTARAPYDMGRTASHEIGHFLGLFHIWGDRFCGTDYVGDTPTDAAANTKGTCSDSSNCINSKNYTPDQTNNFMDYSPDRCMNLFTLGQKNRMRAVLEIIPRRMELLNSPGCCGGEQLALVPYVEDFESYKAYNLQPYLVDNPGNNDFKLFPAGEESKSAFLFQAAELYNSTDINNGNYGSITTPFTQFTEIKNPFVSFSFAYPNTLPNITDSLVVSTQSNCTEWVVSKILYGQELISSQSPSEGFAPQATDWKNVTLALPELAGKAIGRVKLEYFASGGGNALYIDNLNIYESRKNLEIQGYPNPADNKIVFRVFFDGEKNINCRLFTSTGALIFDETFNQSSSLSIPVDVRDLNEGIYFFSINDGSNKATSRIMVKH